MTILQALLILTCYQGAMAEGFRNQSISPKINTTDLPNITSNVSVVPTISTAGSNKSVQVKKGLSNVNNSSVILQLNNTNTPAIQERNDTISNKSTDTFPNMDDTLFNQNLRFFPKHFHSRLATWKEILINASRHCTKLNFSGIEIKENLEIDFPVFRATEVDRDGVFLSFDTIHPVLVRPKTGHDLFKIAVLSIAELWPLLVLCFSCAALAGMIVWLLDSRSNSEQFPKRFWRGIFDGFWWAAVTMTTVGYGDKSPKSFFARLFATVWMVSGIILLSLFTAQVSSRLTTEELKSDDHLFGKKIGVPSGLYHHSDYTDYRMAYSLVKEIGGPIESAAAFHDKGIHSVVVFHCEDKETDNTWEVIQLMPPCEVGAEIYFKIQPSSDELTEIDGDHDYANCMTAQKRMAQNNGKRTQESLGIKTKKLHSSCNKLLEQRDQIKFQFKWVYFKNLSQYLIPFGTVIGLIILSFIVGTVWDCCCRSKRNSYQRSDLEASQPGSSLRKTTKEEEAMLAQK